MINSISERTQGYIETINTNQSNVLTSLDSFNNKWPECKRKISGKVREIYEYDDILVIITTDRQSAFDRNLIPIPYKGKVLNLLSNWWFQQTNHIVPNAFILSPHPNVTIAKKCHIYPIDFIVRGYITGTTETSMWTNYNNGVRNYCGYILPENLRKNQKLENILLTPTTKSEAHDALTSEEEILALNIMSKEDYNKCKEYAYGLFQYGTELCQEKGLILVDTKYEFGYDQNNECIRVVDEIHTPDSSRFWMVDTYQQRFDAGEEPENIDKEVLRRWYVSQCDPYNTAISLPTPPTGLVSELSRRYILAYEIITGECFDLSLQQTQTDSIITTVQHYFQQLQQEESGNK